MNRFASTVTESVEPIELMSQIKNNSEKTCDLLAGKLTINTNEMSMESNSYELSLNDQKSNQVFELIYKGYHQKWCQTGVGSGGIGLD